MSVIRPITPPICFGFSLKQHIKPLLYDASNILIHASYYVKDLTPVRNIVIIARVIFAGYFWLQKNDQEFQVGQLCRAGLEYFGVPIKLFSLSSQEVLILGDAIATIWRRMR